jgi:hypothetical protein
LGRKKLKIISPYSFLWKKARGMVFCRFFGCQDQRFGRAHVAQLAEHVLGKDEVISSNLIMGSKLKELELQLKK